MTSWLLKAAVQGAVSVLPVRDRVNDFFQRNVSGSVAPSEAGFERKVAQCRRHLENYRENGAAERDPLPGAVLELGTGWYPIVPIGLTVAGVDRVITTDVRSLCDLGKAREALRFFASRLQSGQLQMLLPQIDSERARLVISTAADRTSHDARQVLERLGIQLLVCDVRQAHLPAASVDLFVSNNTLEHIAPDVLREIMAEFHRLARPAAVMNHFIDMSDHYAHFDSEITEFNCLRYSDRVWRVFNNRLHYQNRLRVSDYRRIVEDAGFRIVAEELGRGPVEELNHVKLAAPFRRYPSEELIALRCWLTAVALDSAAVAA
jgi:hypothetical protein